MQPSTNGQTEGDATADARIGTLIAERYRIVRLIGRGGMASVYEAADTALPRRVALKVFRPELADGDELRRHEAEVGMLAGLNHPGLVTLFDAVTDERGAAVLVLELVDGTDLREVMDARTLPRPEVASIGAIVAEALAYSHGTGIIHRDVKPANILVPRRVGGHTGSPAKLADFGIARLVDDTRVTAIGSIIGTAQYLSPEQALGGDVGPSTDVYSLGLVLIEALGGARPFAGTGVESVAARLANDPELPEGLPADWVELLQGMTAREADRRLPAAEAARALRRLADVVTTNDDELAPTAVMPQPLVPAGGATAITEVLGAARPVASGAVDEQATVAMAAPSPARTTTSAPATLPPVSATHAPLRRNALIAAAVAAVIVVGGAIAFGLAFGAATSPAAPAAGSPAYPAVDGPVGEHLEQLQRSVAP